LLGVNTVGATAFWRAAYGTDVPAMKLLVKYGADITIPTIKPMGRLPGDDSGGSSGGGGSSGSSDRYAVAERAVATRAELYRDLETTADLLEKLEPRSPVPYLVRRAVALGNLPFPELFRALVQDPVTLAQISREFALPGASE